MSACTTFARIAARLTASAIARRWFTSRTLFRLNA
jgi:hypothetical protein